MKTTKVQIDDVVRAAIRIGPHLQSTPLVESQNRGTFLKLESEQVTGAYKVRGALNALMIQAERKNYRPVIAASAGNHSLGLAWAAQKLGVKATAVVPKTTPKGKVLKARSLGANIILHGTCFEDAYQYALSLAQTHDWHFLHAFDDPDVIAGQGTIAFELLPYRPDVVAVPVGGGGLISGLATVLCAHGVRVFGVQVEGVDAMKRALGSGLSGFKPKNTIADGIRVQAPGNQTQTTCRHLVEDIVLVTEEEVRTSIAELCLDHGLTVEGAGALAYAGLKKVPGRRKVAVVSGRNIDEDLHREVLGDYIRNRVSDGLRPQNKPLNYSTKLSYVLTEEYSRASSVELTDACS